MTTLIADFLSEARDVSLLHAAELCAVEVRGKGPEHAGPCPVCGGRDRFSINFQKGLWNCRSLGSGGDAFALVAYKFGYDLKSRSGLLAVASILNGRPVPEGGESETETERQSRQERLAEREARQAHDRETRARESEDYRSKAIKKAKGTFQHATPVWRDGGRLYGAIVADYLQARTGFEMPGKVLENLHWKPAHPYWHGVDDLGRPIEFYCGPAMLAPFVDLNGEINGCHETWIDMTRYPKCRPILEANGEGLPTKKMQGAVKGCLIPLCGSMALSRWMTGEGIETVLAMAAAEGFRNDTFYCATGSLGNLAGPADPASSFSHPTAKKEVIRKGKNGAPDTAYNRAVTVAGPVPLAGTEHEALPIQEHVTELVMLADGDSEFIWTASNMARAENRFRAAGRIVSTWWPPEGQDFADALKGAA